MYQGLQYTKNFVESKLILKFNVIEHLVFLFSVCAGVWRMGLRNLSVVGSGRGIPYIV